MTRRRTYAIALGGVLSAAAAAVMLLGSVIPFATFLSPAIAALSVLYFCIEFDKKTAFLVYFVVAALSVLFAADKEQAFLFAFVLGYYPIIKTLAERLRAKVVVLFIKLGLFNLSVLILYYIMINLFVVETVRAEFAQYTVWLLGGLLVMANIAFWLYDVVMTRLSVWYVARLQPRLNRPR